VVTYATPGNYTATLISSNDFGMDTENISLDLGSNLTFELNAELCFGADLVINDVIYNENNPTGTEVIQNGSVNGCDSTVIIALTFANSIESETIASICSGETYDFGGDQLTTSGVYTFETTGSGGCDSLATLSLTVEETTLATANVDLCKGDEYNGQEYVEDATIVETMLSINGCDSIIETTNIHILPTFFTEVEATIFDGESYTVGNSTYIESGLYYDILTAQNGCDSIIELKLTVDFTDAIQTLNNPKVIDLQTYPNPFSRKVNISFLAEAQDFPQLEIFNTNGQRVSAFSKSINYQNGRYYCSLDFMKLPQGLYWCKIHLSAGIFMQKLVLL